MNATRDEQAAALTGPVPGAGTRLRPRQPISRLLDAIGSVWFGVTMLVLVLVYCWLGSAGTMPVYPWLASRHFELTEMQWYAWWPFRVLLALMSLSLILVTLRRIAFNRFNLGVLTVHGGILVLVAGSAVYFSSKLEGDMLVYRHRAALSVDGGDPVELVVRPDEAAEVEGDSRRYRVRVIGATSDYTLLTGTDRGKRAHAVQLMVEPVVDGKPGERFIRQLISGYPQYTEDVIPGVGRAKKELGKAIVDPHLGVRLVEAPSDTIYLAERPALLARRVGAAEWSEMPLAGLPRYREYAEDPSDVLVPFSARDTVFRPLRLELEAPRPEAGAGAGALPPLDYAVTGFLPFATPQTRWHPGGDRFDPFIRFSVVEGEQTSTRALLARERGADRATLPGGLEARFVWLETPDALEALARPARAKLLVEVKDRDLRRSIPLADLKRGEVPVEGTDCRLALVEFYPRWHLASETAPAVPVSLAMIRVTSPERRFTRSVIHPFVSLSQDMDDEGRHAGRVDANLTLKLEDVPFYGLTLAAGDDAVHALLTAEDRVVRVPVTPGEPVRLGEAGPELTVHEVSRTAHAAVAPRLIPGPDRDRNNRDSYRMIRVELAGEGGWHRTVWVRYSHYDFPNRLGYHPVEVPLPGGGAVELLFSRQRHRLGSAVVLDDFFTETYPGKKDVRNYISAVRFREGEGWSDPVRISSNHPAEHAGWWYFQSTWDPPDLNYTGLGVGNRHGVMVMLLGSIMVVLGTLYAFYVKPVLLRRRRQRNELRRAVRPAAVSPEASKPAVAGGVSAGRAGVVLLALLLAAGCSGGGDPLVQLSVNREFADQVHLDAFRLVAVQEANRVKTVDSLAREKLKYVNPRLVRKVDPVLLYLDLVFAPEHYRTVNLIQVKKNLRYALVRAVQLRTAPADRTGVIRDAELDRIAETGLVSPAFLEHPTVGAVIDQVSRDVMRSGKDVDRLHAGLAYTRSRILVAGLMVVPPPRGDVLDPWYPLPADDGSAAGDAAPAGPGGRGLAVPGLADGVRARILDDWGALRTAWHGHDAVAASRALDDLALVLPEVRPDLYPTATRLELEHWYHRNSKLIWTWILYLAASTFLIMAVVFGFGWARKLGLALFLAGFALHSVSIGLRWYLAGRIPNANMFEALTAAAWFGCAVALVMEVLFRRWSLRSVPAFAAATGAMFAMMISNFLPVTLSSDINTVAPLLDRTVWLYIHTNMVIASYALIFFGGVSALLYLVIRVVYDLVPERWPALSAIWLGPTGDAPVSGGAAALILSGGAPSRDMTRAGLARTLDGATMIFMEIGFVMLWVGTVLGAVWADVSWGRPWGWDPKEVFALNTWIVFLILIHVRLKTRDKALWTALLAIIGCVVMLFNWIAVNFAIVGLHSYA